MKVIEIKSISEQICEYYRVKNNQNWIGKIKQICIHVQVITCEIYFIFYIVYETWQELWVGISGKR